jgi:lysophospholipase L1-like esterase
MEKPVVVYGTSIAQGACASRPGMAWTSILGRKIDRPLINLAFSGNGRLEEELIDLLVEIDAKIYVLDCLPNLVPSRFTAEDVSNRILTSVSRLRQKHPDTPILLTDHAGYTDGLINAERRKAFEEVNEVQKKAFAQLKSEGIEHIYLLPIEEINLDIETTVDGTHPNDLGMFRYAEAYEKTIREILHEPVGAFTTMQPCIQYREPNNYDWETRHRELLQMNKTQPPRIVFLGNSITHFWGGQPAGPFSNGSDSWNQYLAPLGVRNFGYGWDRIENVLWRVYHGELDGYEAEQIVMMIGTNNLHLC